MATVTKPAPAGTDAEEHPALFEATHIQRPADGVARGGMDAVAPGAPDTISREEILLSEEQRAYLTSQIGAGALARRALADAAMTPAVLSGVVRGLRRLRWTWLVEEIPLVGFLVLVYGFIAIFAAAVVGVFAIPVVFLVTLPVALFAKRPKLRADLASGTAVRYSGSFPVKLGTNKLSRADLRRRATLVCGETKFDVSAADLKSIAPALVDSGASDEVLVLHGTIERTLHHPILLRVRDQTGRDLFAVGPEGGRWKAVAAPQPAEPAS